MPSVIAVKKAKIVEGIDPFLTANLETADGTPLVQADIASGIDIELRVWDQSAAGAGRDANTAIFSKTDISITAGGPNAAAAILDTFATTYWDGLDDTGHNFQYQLLWDSTNTTGPYLRAGHIYLAKFNVESILFGEVRWSYELEVSAGDRT